MSLGAHLIEFRNRLFISAAAIVVGTVAGWFLTDWVWDALRRPINDIGDRVAQITYSDIGSGFDLRLQIALFIGVLAASPIWLYQIWAFFAPGLTRREKGYAVGFIAVAVPLFLGGAYAGWTVLPNIVRLMASFQPTEDAFQLNARTYLDFAVKLMLAVGIGFVMPVFLVMLNFLGVLLGGVTATRRGKVVVIGGGAAGEQAARIAFGMGAEVVIIDISIPRLKQLEDEFDGRIQTRTSNAHNITEALRDADLVIGSVLIPGEKAPKLVTDEMVAQMKPGSVLVDIAIDQGGCFESSRPTTHDDPTFPVHESIYYCVANMPGAVPETSTAALTNATLPYVVALADRGWGAALAADEALARGLNAHAGIITNQGVAEAFPELPSAPYAEVVAANS